MRRFSPASITLLAVDSPRMPDHVGMGSSASRPGCFAFAWRWARFVETTDTAGVLGVVSHRFKCRGGDSAWL
jgi:hypothetical protein